MTSWKQLQQTLALIAGLGLVVPTTAFSDDRAQPAARAAAPKAISPDIALTAEGAFRGSLIDGSKKPMADVTVILKKDGQKVASVQTDAKGVYTFPNLAQGAYQLEVQKQLVPIRVWKAAIAPPKALKQLDMAYVPNKDVVRGQFGYLDPVNTSLILLGVAGVVLGAIAVSEINDLQDDVNKLQSP
jgi:Carboxypeptidase regulatory-like domain